MFASARLMTFLLAAFGFCHVPALGGPPENLLANPGFESVRSGEVLSWSTPEYWSGSIVPASDAGAARSEKRSARLTAAEKQGRHWGRVLQSLRVRSLTGRRFRYLTWVKGSGDFLLGCIEYRSAEKHKPHYKYRWQATPVVLRNEWQEAVFEFSVSDPEVRSLAVVAEIRGVGSEALLDDAAFVPHQEPGFTASVMPSHAMVPVGETLNIEVRIEQNGKAAGGGHVTVVVMAPDQDVVSREVEVTASGAAVFPFKAARDTAAGIHRLVISHAASGAVADCFVDVTNQETWNTFADVAKRAQLRPIPAHLLIIGDSLTDQQRGYNYVDKLALWLGRSYGAKLTYRNAGVGGDYISRVWQRMNGDAGAYRLSMYDGLFEPKPTHVFFFLGHNDSKVSSTSGYTHHCVAPETFEEEYRLAIRKVQKETGAKIIVMSATSSVFEICKANADKRQAAGRPHNLFGKPEELEKFNAIAKRVAAELGADYVDVYKPTQTHADKPSLFNPRDGVHLTNAGNRFIALELLKYFTRR